MDGYGTGLYGPLPFSPSMTDGSDGRTGVTDLNNFGVAAEDVFDRVGMLL